MGSGLPGGGVRSRHAAPCHAARAKRRSAAATRDQVGQGTYEAHDALRGPACACSAGAGTLRLHLEEGFAELRHDPGSGLPRKRHGGARRQRAVRRRADGGGPQPAGRRRGPALRSDAARELHRACLRVSQVAGAVSRSLVECPGRRVSHGAQATADGALALGLSRARAPGCRRQARTARRVSRRVPARVHARDAEDRLARPQHQSLAARSGLPREAAGVGRTCRTRRR